MHLFVFTLISVLGYVAAYNIEQSLLAPNKCYVPIGGVVVPGTVVTITAPLPGKVIKAGRENDTIDADSILIMLENKDLLLRQRQAKESLTAIKEAVREYTENNISKGVTNEVCQKYSQNLFVRPIEDIFQYLFPVPHGNEYYSEYGLSGSPESCIVTVKPAICQLLEHLDRTLLNIRELDEKTRKLKVTAPFMGIIIRKYISVGDWVYPGRRVLEFTRGFQIKARMSSHSARYFKTGDIVPAKLEARGRTVIINVSVISIIREPSGYAYIVKYSLPDLPPKLNAVIRNTYAEIAVELPCEGHD
ncbi:MAG: HlyD family secretion protein [Gammaproteobacteria bacterium]|nr:HlyD family secretion protein [Gammaproteobacteria bacterium]